MMKPIIAHAIMSIASDHRSGATEIAEQAAEVFIQFVQTDTSAAVNQFYRNLLDVGFALINAQPTMASLVNLVNAILWSIEGLETLQALHQAVSDTASSFKRRLHINEVAIAELVLPLIAEGSRVVTLSRSTTVKTALRHAQHAGRRFSVICAEGRPGFEGRTMVTELSESGIPAILVVDALAISHVAQAQLVMVGADHLQNDVLVNKVGTYGMALAARDKDVPIYALCGSDKFLPSGYSLAPQPFLPEWQVWENPPPGGTIQNSYFDHTPISYFWGIVTEQGVLPPIGVEAWMASIKIHAALQQTLSS